MAGLIRGQNQGVARVTRRSERRLRRALAEVLALFADPVRKAVRAQ